MAQANRGVVRARGAIGRVARNHPVCVFPDEKCERRDAGWDDATNRSIVLTQSCRMGGETAPADGSGEAKTVEDVRIVVGAEAGENLLLPRTCRGFASLQLLQRFERAALAEQLRFRRDVLPA